MRIATNARDLFPSPSLNLPTVNGRILISLTALLFIILVVSSHGYAREVYVGAERVCGVAWFRLWTNGRTGERFENASQDYLGKPHHIDLAARAPLYKALSISHRGPTLRRHERTFKALIIITTARYFILLTRRKHEGNFTESGIYLYRYRERSRNHTSTHQRRKHAGTGCGNPTQHRIPSYIRKYHVNKQEQRHHS